MEQISKNNNIYDSITENSMILDKKPGLLPCKHPEIASS